MSLSPDRIIELDKQYQGLSTPLGRMGNLFERLEPAGEVNGLETRRKFLEKLKGQYGEIVIRRDSADWGKGSDLAYDVGLAGLQLTFARRYFMITLHQGLELRVGDQSIGVLNLDPADGLHISLPVAYNRTSESKKIIIDRALNWVKSTIDYGIVVVPPFNFRLNY